MTENGKKIDENNEDAIFELGIEDFEIIDKKEKGLTERDLKIQAFKDFVGEEIAAYIELETVGDEQLESLLEIARQIHSKNRDVRDLISKIHKVLGREEVETGLEEFLYKEKESSVMDGLFPTTRAEVEKLEEEHSGDPRLDKALKKTNIQFKPVHKESTEAWWKKEELKAAKNKSSTVKKIEQQVAGLKSEREKHLMQIKESYRPEKKKVTVRLIKFCKQLLFKKIF